MKLKFNKNKINELFSDFEKIRPFIVMVILIQFVLVGIIFLQSHKNKHAIEQINSIVSAVENKQKKLNEQLDLLQANIMKVSAQIHKLSKQ